MKKALILILVLFCSLHQTEAKTKQRKKKAEKEAIIFDPPIIWEENVSARRYRKQANPYRDKRKQLSDSLKQLLLLDPNMNIKLSSSEYVDIFVNQSADKKIRIVSWCRPDNSYSSCKYEYLVQYYIAPNKTRCIYSEDRWNNKWSRTEFDNIGFGHSIFINSIEHLRNGIYLIKGSGFNTHRLYAVDIERGILKDAHIFFDSKGIPTNVLFYETAPFRANNANDTYILCKEHLQVAEMDSLKKFTGNYKDYYFNGACFDDAKTYDTRSPYYLKEGGYKILRSYYRDYFNADVITKGNLIYGVTLLTDVAHYNKLIKQREPFLVSINDTIMAKDSVKHFIRLVFPLIIRNQYIFVENLNLKGVSPITLDTKNEKNELTKVIHVVGQEKALSYQWLRYTALAFDCEMSKDDCYSVRWAVEIDDKLHLLEGEEYEGSQIDLQMKEEWIGKTICVIPYIVGYDINKEIRVKTTIEND